MIEVRKFLKQLEDNEQAVEILKEKDNLKDMSEMYPLLFKAAQTAGISVTEEELKEAFEGFEAQQKQKSDDAGQMVELSMDELDEVVGGKRVGYHKEYTPHTIFIHYCMDTYQPGENCWFLDECDYVMFGKYDWIPEGYAEK